jgi:fatty-acid desaturase
MTRGYALAAFAVFAPPAAVVAAAALWIGGVAPSQTDLIVLALGTAATLLGVELGFHRYFTHRSFTAHPALIWVLAATTRSPTARVIRTRRTGRSPACTGWCTRMSGGSSVPNTPR